MVCVGFEDRFRKHQFSIYMSHKVGFISHKYNFKNKKGEYWLNETKEYLIMDRILFKDFLHLEISHFSSLSHDLIYLSL